MFRFRGHNSTDLFILILYVTIVDSRFNGIHRMFIATKHWHSVYDYVIVGGGTAGTVLASRLAEDNSTTVLLLEAGGMETMVSQIPLGWSVLRKSDIDWDFKIEPQSVACYGFNHKFISWPKGKVFGGSSGFGNLVYTRGNRKDYDNWSENGSIGWSWDDLFPYFLLSENNEDANISNNGFHGRGGHMSIKRSPFQSSLAELWIEAGKVIGYNNLDVNADKQSGFNVPQGTINGGSRQSVAKSYIISRPKRANLHILLNAIATRVVFDDYKRAFAVQFTHSDQYFTVKARKEIILSAGAVNTPKLLMLSGIGPADHLKQIGIPSIVDLPVGDNLQDHIYAGGIDFKMDQTITSLKRSSAFNNRNILDYVSKRNGPLTSFGGIEGIAFVNTKYVNVSLDWPDVQLILVNGDFNDNRFNLLEHIFDELNQTRSTTNTFSILPVLLRPQSVGTVRLRSSNPMDPPVIDPNYLTHPEDIMTMVAAMKIALAVGTSAPFKRIKSRLLLPTLDECEQYTLLNDKFFACWARMLTNTFYDPVGTCRMGSKSDPSSVVDPELKVLGVNRLRVVDASVIPKIVSGNTNAITVTIAEKAADLIKGRRLRAYMTENEDDLMYEE